jgi:hypothetical protein
METAPTYQSLARAVRRAARAPVSVSAVPGVEEAATDWAARKAQQDFAASTTAKELELGEKRIAAEDKEFHDRMALERRQMDVWSKENDWSRLIMAANIGIQAADWPVKEKQIAQVEQLGKDLVAGQKRIQTLEESRLRTAVDTAQSYAPYINPPAPPVDTTGLFMPSPDWYLLPGMSLRGVDWKWPTSDPRTWGPLATPEG